MRLFLAFRRFRVLLQQARSSWVSATPVSFTAICGWCSNLLQELHASSSGEQDLDLEAARSGNAGERERDAWLHILLAVTLLN